MNTCEICNKRIKINWGSGSVCVCRDCYGSDAAHALLANSTGRVPDHKPAFPLHNPTLVVVAAGAGFLLGLPMSYWFQPGIVRMATSLPDYIGYVLGSFFPSSERTALPSDVLTTVGFTVFVLFVLGALCGFYLDWKSQKQINKPNQAVQ